MKSFPVKQEYGWVHVHRLVAVKRAMLWNDANGTVVTTYVSFQILTTKVPLMYTMQGHKRKIQNVLNCRRTMKRNNLGLLHVLLLVWVLIIQSLFPSLAAN